jgi:hypothetical protein
MMKQEFARLIQDLCLFFGKEEPTAGRAQAWYEVVRHLPGGAFADFALARIKAGEAHFPANPARLLLLAFEEYGDKGALAPAPGEQPPCPHCRDSGVLAAARGDERFFFRCGHCNRPDAAGLATATVQALENAGFRLLN